MSKVYFIDVNTILPTHTGSATWIVNCAKVAIETAIKVVGKNEIPEFNIAPNFELVVWEAYRSHCIYGNKDNEDFGVKLARLLLGRDLEQEELEYAQVIMSKGYRGTTTITFELKAVIDRLLAEGSYVFFFGNCTKEEEALLEEIFGKVVISRSMLSSKTHKDMYDLDEVYREAYKIMGKGTPEFEQDFAYFCTNKVKGHVMKLTSNRPSPIADRLDYQRDIVSMMCSIDEEY